MAQLDRATVCGTVGRRFESSWAHHISGEVAERSKAVDSKSAVPYGYRGFESHPLLSPPRRGNLPTVNGERRSLSAIQNLGPASRWPAAVCRSFPEGELADGSLQEGILGRNSKYPFPALHILKRRGGRAVEGARLESVCRFTPTEGSNPSLSATLPQRGNGLTVNSKRQSLSTIHRFKICAGPCPVGSSVMLVCGDSPPGVTLAGLGA